MAARILAIIASRSLVPSRALTAFAEANPPSTPRVRTASLGPSYKKTRRGDVQQAEDKDGDLSPEYDVDDSDYSEGSPR